VQLDNLKLETILHQGFTGWVRIHLSPNHIFSAFYLARLARQLEHQGDSTDQIIREQHRGIVISGVLASVAFLEAAINELYVSASEPFGNNSLTEELQKRLKAIWSLEVFRRNARILEKYQVALELAGHEPFLKGANPYQDVKLLIDLRNALVHFVPSTTPIVGQPEVEIPLDEFGKQLRGKFPENPWKAKYSLISSGPEPEPATWPFFPEGCLGSGCAFWSAQSALAFADEFFNKLDVKWYYEHLRTNLLLEDD
jgi:hypothetical protein